MVHRVHSRIPAVVAAALLAMMALGAASIGIADEGPTGTIQGVVVSEHFEPIAGATLHLVQVEELVATTTTDAQGGYAFTEVAIGEYRVLALAEAYHEGVEHATVHADQVTTLNFMLERILEPWSERFDFDGRMVFGVDTPAATVYGGLGQDDHVVRFDFPVQPRWLETVVVEAYWSSQLPLAGMSAHLTYGSDCVSCGPIHEYGSGAGFGAIAFRVDHQGGHWPLMGISATTLTIDVYPERGDEALSVLLQQDFTLHVEAFYIEPAPEDHQIVDG